MLELFSTANSTYRTCCRGHTQQHTFYCIHCQLLKFNFQLLHGNGPSFFNHVCLPCWARRPYNLYCVGGDVKPCTIYLSICHARSGLAACTQPTEATWLCCIQELWVSVIQVCHFLLMSSGTLPLHLHSLSVSRDLLNWEQTGHKHHITQVYSVKTITSLYSNQWTKQDNQVLKHAETWTFQMWTHLSKEPLAMCRPSGLNATL